MNALDAIILGIIQGLTEFLPVSSSGHLEIGKALLHVDIEEDLGFTVMVHLATVLSTITVFFKEIRTMLNGLFSFRWNEETSYILKLILSSVPVIFVGLFFEEEVESLFSSGLGKDHHAILLVVGPALLLTALLLGLTTRVRSNSTKKVSFRDSVVIGIAQALAVIPGLSRSGSTIATGLLLKNNREAVARFSFLMVLLPILGASVLKISDWADADSSSAGIFPLIAGFVAAYISGFLACKWMIGIVKKGKLIWFAVYCAVIGLVSIIFSL